MVWHDDVLNYIAFVVPIVCIINSGRASPSPTTINYIFPYFSIHLDSSNIFIHTVARDAIDYRKNHSYTYLMYLIEKDRRKKGAAQ